MRDHQTQQVVGASDSHDGLLACSLVCSSRPVCRVDRYQLMEELVPNGSYLEIFGRRNNLHNGWVTIGNEL